MIQEKMVSIVLPIYNGEKYMEESINSVINQTYTRWELIIVDDCSSDKTSEIANKYVEKDGRIKYFRNEINMKLPKTLNRGFSASNGDYLTWTSDDNIFKSDAIKEMVYCLEKYKVDFVYASCDLIDENGIVTGQYIVNSTDNKAILGENFVGACFMYTRRVYDNIGEYNPEKFLVEDYDYWLRIFSDYDVYAIRNTLYMYRMHKDSLTSSERKEIINLKCENILLEHVSRYGKLRGYQKYNYFSHLDKLCELKENPEEKRKYKGEIRKYYFFYLLNESIRKSKKIRNKLKISKGNL